MCICANTASKYSSYTCTYPHAYTCVHSQCVLYDLRVRRIWRGMNLVKKTPIWLHWRLFTKLSYIGVETPGEMGKEEEEGNQRLTLQGENRSSSAPFFQSFAHQFPSSGSCLLSKLISSDELGRLVQIQNNRGQRTLLHTNKPLVCISVKNRILYKHSAF